jgi:hypothetical protein
MAESDSDLAALEVRIARLEKRLDGLKMTVGYACGVVAGWASYEFCTRFMKWSPPLAELAGIAAFFVLSLLLFEGNSRRGKTKL